MSSENRCENDSDVIAHLTEMSGFGYEAEVSSSGVISITTPLGQKLSVGRAICFHIDGGEFVGHPAERILQLGMSDASAKVLQNTCEGTIYHSSPALRKEILDTLGLEEVLETA